MGAEGGVLPAGLRVLIPRPQRDQDALVDELGRRGCQPLSLPVLEIEPLKSAALLTQARRAAAEADILIFVSGNAVDGFFQLLSATGTEFPRLTATYAVGRATAQALARRGLRADYPREQATSEGLLAMASLQQVTGRKVVICRGDGGRDHMSQTLKARGAEVSYLNLYRRRPTRAFAAQIKDLIRAQAVDLVIVHSGEILAALDQCLDDDTRDRVRGLPFLVPGQRVAELVAEWGAQWRIQAVNALPEAMVAALLGCYTGSTVDRANAPVSGAKAPAGRREHRP